MKEVSTLEEAVQYVTSGDHLHWPCCAAAPEALIKAMVNHVEQENLKDIHITHLHTEGNADYASNPRFHLESFFVGQNVRHATQIGMADYIPCSLSHIPRIIRERDHPIDGVFLMVSEPDDQGYVSLGTSVDCTLTAISQARYVIAQINKYVPFCYGDARIPLSKITIAVRHDEPLPESDIPPLSKTDKTIGRLVSELIPNGATLQIGIGSIPNAILSQLGDHKNLGVHTELFSDGVLPLIESGVINNSKKITDPGKMVSTFLNGTKKLYDFVDHNHDVMMQNVGYTNNPAVIARNPKVVALNSALQIDLSGQVCADSIGTKIYSGSGGQLDFMIGATWSTGGVPIIAKPSITKSGISKIVPTLVPGAGVVTPRTYIHWVVTEYGAVNLFGKGIHDRAKLLISIAHPDAREELERALREEY